MSASNFMVEFSMYSIMSSANSDSFTSFPLCIPFIYFFLWLLWDSKIYSWLCYVFDVWERHCMLSLQNEHTNAIFLPDLFW